VAAGQFTLDIDSFPFYLAVVYLMTHSVTQKNRESSIGIAAGYGLDGRDSIPDRAKIFFSTPQRPDRLWGPPRLLYNGYRGVFRLGVKRPGREADHSPPSSA
jgi:hypothetical protein